MYHVINAHVATVLQKIKEDHKHVSEYDYLRTHLKEVDRPEYQRRFKVFWRLNTARLGDQFCEFYFKVLKDSIKEKPDIKAIAKTLYCVETHKDRNSLQFSFASKLFHMVNPHAPIYDSLVAAFFFFSEPAREKSINIRIDELAAFYDFLIIEYRRVLEEKLLHESIQKFRKELKPKEFTDEKVLDSLIWAFVSLQRGGGAIRRQVTYC